MATDRTETPGYRAMHNRLEHRRGKASHFACAECGKPAVHWSYDHADSDEVTENWQGYAVTFSRKLEHYEPLCRGCHALRDKGDTCRRGHPYVEGSFRLDPKKGRRCLECAREDARRHRQRERGEALPPLPRMTRRARRAWLLKRLRGEDQP